MEVVRHWVAALLVLAFAGTAAAQRSISIENPYQGIDWGTVNSYKMGTHEHAGVYPFTSETRMDAMADEGYDVLPYFTYSGYIDASSALYLSTYRHQPYVPISDYIDNTWLDAQQAAGRLVLYGAEEVAGTTHFTSYFFNDFIVDYGTAQTAADFVNGGGGVVFLNHPELAQSTYDRLTGILGIEVYNALYRHWDEDAAGTRPADYNDTKFIPYWDDRLTAGIKTFGLASNDHAGVWEVLAEAPTAETVDSGRILVFATSLTESSMSGAIRNGAFFAVKDIAAVKDAHPDVTAVAISGTTITVTSDETVTWISMDATVGTGAAFNVATLDPDTVKYIRAQTENAAGSIVYLQPFMLTGYDTGAWNTADDWTGEACSSAGPAGDCIYTFTDADDRSNAITVNRGGGLCFDPDIDSGATGARVRVWRVVTAATAAGSVPLQPALFDGVAPNACAEIVSTGEYWLEVVDAPPSGTTAALVARGG